MAYSKILPRRGTKHEFELENPVLVLGEMVVEAPDSGIGTGLCKMKIGDGVTPYRSLPYAIDGTAASSIDGGTPSDFSIIQLRGATASVWNAVNPILSLREPGYDITNRSIKVGDGVHTWTELEFIKASDFVPDASGNVVFDFGDEDTISVSAAERRVLDNSTYEENVLPDGWDDDLNRSTGGVDLVPMGARSKETTAGINDLIKIPDGPKINANFTNEELEDIAASENLVVEAASEDTKTEEATTTKSSKSSKKKSSATDTQDK